MRIRNDDGSTIPLILGFFLLALTLVAASVALGQVFVQQRDLQDICDGAAAAAAASSADLDRGASVASRSSLQFDGVGRVVDAYLARDPVRREVDVHMALSDDHERITLHCAADNDIVFGRFLGRRQVHHTATSSARAAVVD